MNRYKDYMDSKTVDTALHKKIIRRIAEPPRVSKNKRIIAGFAGAAACAAALALGFMIIPGLLDRPSVVGDGFINGTPHNGNGYAANPPNYGDDILILLPPNLYSTYPALFPPVPNQDRRPLYGLAFNTEFNEMGSSRIVGASFNHGLTDEQSRSVFPNLAPGFEAIAGYWLERDNRPYWTRPLTETFSLIPPNAAITAIEVTAFDYSRRAQIQLAEGGLIDTIVFADTEPQYAYVHGVQVRATLRERYAAIDGKSVLVYWVQADFVLGEIAYRVRYYNAQKEAAKTRLTELVNQLIHGGAADWSVLLNPEIPELREEAMPLREARNDPDFGAFLPATVPVGFNFESAHRSLSQTNNSLRASWNVGPPGFDRITWTVRTTHESDATNNRTFLAEELTLETIRERTRWVDGDMGDTPGYRTSQFNVLFGDVVVTVDVRGLTAEQIWGMLGL